MKKKNQVFGEEKKSSCTSQVQVTKRQKELQKEAMKIKTTFRRIKMMQFLFQNLSLIFYPYHFLVL